MAKVSGGGSSRERNFIASAKLDASQVTDRRSQTGPNRVIPTPPKPTPGPSPKLGMQGRPTPQGRPATKDPNVAKSFSGGPKGRPTARGRANAVTRGNGRKVGLRTLPKPPTAKPAAKRISLPKPSNVASLRSRADARSAHSGPTPRPVPTRAIPIGKIPAPTSSSSGGTPPSARVAPPPGVSGSKLETMPAVRAGARPAPSRLGAGVPAGTRGISSGKVGAIPIKASGKPLPRRR